jgi:hypothetical protein
MILPVIIRFCSMALSPLEGATLGGFEIEGEADLVVMSRDDEDRLISIPREEFFLCGSQFIDSNRRQAAEQQEEELRGADASSTARRDIAYRRAGSPE